MDTLIVTCVAVADLRGDRPAARHLDGQAARGVDAVITPVLDVMQTMPSFAYLAPLVLFFGIGPASAVVVHADLLAAAAGPDHRARHPQRSARRPSRRPGRSASSRRQLLRTVQLPMARRTIVVGINQCTMAALSMATIAALDQRARASASRCAQALQSLDVGDAFVAGLAIVIMAIMLDRTTTAASERAEQVATPGGARRRRASAAPDRPGARRGRRR